MSLPRKEVAIDLLKKYVKARNLDETETVVESENGNTFAGVLSWTRDTVAWLGKKAFRQQSDQDLITRIEAFVTQINNLEKFDDYKRLIIDLGEYAYTAAENKFDLFQKVRVTQKESLLSRTLHAIRSYMVETVVNDPQSKFYNDFQKLIAEDAKKRQDCLDYIADTRTESSINIAEKEKERDSLTIKLAYLGNPEAISFIIDKGLLDRLPRHTHGGIPVLQKGYHRKFYEKELKIVKTDTFEEYCAKVANEAHARSENRTGTAANSGLFSDRPRSEPPVYQPDEPKAEDEEGLRKSAGKA